MQQSVKSKLETRPFSFQVSKRKTLQPWNRLYSSHRRRRGLPGDPAASWRTMLTVESTESTESTDCTSLTKFGPTAKACFVKLSFTRRHWPCRPLVCLPPFSCSCFWPKVQRWLRPPDFATVGVSLQTPPSPTIACLQLNCGEIKLSMFQSPNVYADCECLKNHQDMHSRYVCKFVCVCVPCACPQIYRLFKWCAGYENSVHTHTACCMPTCLFCKGAT